MAQQFYIAATVIVRNQEGRYLICRRHPEEKVFPGKWCVPGGKLDLSDFVYEKKDTPDHWFGILEKALKREVREETGLEIDHIGYVANILLELKDSSYMMIFSMRADRAGGEVRLAEAELTDYRWISPEMTENYDLIDGIREQIHMADAFYTKRL